MNASIFRKKSLERISSPDKLDDYIKVSNPSVWVVLAALMLAVVAAAVWCLFGSIPTAVTGVGIRSQAGVECFLSVNEGTRISPGMQVRVTTENGAEPLLGTVEEVGEPAEALQAAANVGAEWLTERMPGNWVCPITIQIENESIPVNADCSVHIILNERRPIELLLGR